MDNFIFYPLIILIVIGSFSQLYYFSETNLGSEDNDYTQDITGTQTLNETETDISVAGGILNLGFTMTVGLVAIIVGAIVLGLIGLNVFGSGLPDFSVKIIWNGIVFYGLWTIFSVLAITAISSLPLFGALFWFFLTFIYSLGVFGRMGK